MSADLSEILFVNVTPLLVGGLFIDIAVDYVIRLTPSGREVLFSEERRAMERAGSYDTGFGNKIKGFLKYQFTEFPTFRTFCIMYKRAKSL